MQKTRLTCALLFSLQFVAMVYCSYVPCEDCTDRANTSLLADIELRIYPDGTSDDYTAVRIGDAVDLLEKIDSSKPTVLYISGWTETPASRSVKTVLTAYFERGDHNVLLADYSKIAAGDWEYASASVDGVGYTLATGLDELVAQGLAATTLHIVGHSLGGQVSGFIGKYVNFTLPRITALDPAGPSFAMIDEHLSSSDATFVDVIHTDPGVYGIGYSTGDVDFYPNGGSRPQPGCKSDSDILSFACSHYRSWAYYAESLVNEDAFVAVACESYPSFEDGLCSGNPTIAMGYATPTTASGIFVLQTNAASPYGRRAEGTTHAA